MMDMDETDSLEGWVAVKEHPFQDNTKHTKLNFIVGWNEVESKIAITCRHHSRTVSDDETSEGWSGVFSLQDLVYIHDQLALVHPSLGPYLPYLPVELPGLWSYFTTLEPPDDSICEELQRYLKVALEICGQKLLMSTLFEEHSIEEYFENVGELRRRGYDDAIDNAKDELKNILFLREGAINMLDMTEVYVLEDESMFKVNKALAKLYNYLLQPFLDQREVALSKVREAKRQIDNPNVGERIKRENILMFTEWQGHYVQALDTIQEIYIKYYTTTVENLTGMYL